MTPLMSPALPGEAPRDGSIAQWLLTGPAQTVDGPHAGAVSGCIDSTGRAAYAYPEITGYYLQWLAWRASAFGHSHALAVHAAAAQRWLIRWLGADDRPQTRIHFDNNVEDWRNRAVFCFDLAMVMRGVAAAAKAELLEPDVIVTTGLARQFERLIAADGFFDACVAHQPDDELPARWSTRRGGFLAKAAAGVLTAAATLPQFPAHVVAAAEATFAASIDSVLDSPHEDVHPLLYAYEGLLNLPAHPRSRQALPAVANQFAALLAQATNDGALPESLHTGAHATGAQRVDLVAQALRVGCLLTAHQPTQPPDRVALARLRQILQRQMAPSGAVAFALGSSDGSANVWAAMFADQALAFARMLAAPGMLPSADPLLV
jgi:hypothetical protein